MDNSSNFKKASHLPLELPVFPEETKVFSGARFNVHRVDLKSASGKKIHREVVVHRGAVLILPFLDKEHIVMIRNERFAVGRELWELPAGTLEVGEQPINTAFRELIEETGYQASQMTSLVPFLTSPGICNEVMYTFVATDLTHVGQSLDENEKIKVEIVSWKEALKFVKDGTIIDGKTMTTLLFYDKFY